VTTRIATAIAAGDSEAAAAAINRDLDQALKGQEASLLVACASTQQPLDKLLPALRTAHPNATVLAASTAGEFTEQKDTKGAASVFALAGDYRVFAGLGTGLKEDPSRAVAEATETLPKAVDGYPHRTGLLLLDPLAGNGEEATLLVASVLGDGVPLAGGAAGDDLHMAATFVGCGDKVATDAIVVGVIFSKAPLGLGVHHGHEALSEPLEVTKAEGGTVYEIGGRPAWDVWAEQTRSHAAANDLDPDKLSGDEVGAYLLRYEAGLASGASLKIRAPLSRNDDGSLNFACGIPQGSMIRITESAPDRQVDSAIEAARKARAQVPDRSLAGALVFDCICRNLILGDRFQSAVVGISDELGGVPVAGFETYGEIALAAGDMSGFHNTTTVVLAFPE